MTKYLFDRVNSIAYIVYLIFATILSIPVVLLVIIYETVTEMKFRWTQHKIRGHNDNKKTISADTNNS